MSTWPPIFAGAFVAVAISTVMTTFGAAISLSATSPISGSSMSGAAWIVATAIWGLGSPSQRFVAGGYLAGRLRAASTTQASTKATSAMEFTVSLSGRSARSCLAI